MAKRITFEGELQLGHLSMLAAASARELYVEELHRLAEKDERIVFVGADSGYGGAENKFREKYPDRMLPVGIAEQDQVGVAAGLALCGKIPYISGFGPFLALRTLDQVHTNLCYPNLPVRIVNTHSGLTSASGPTHYNIMDIAIMRTLPNMTFVIPSDANQCVKLIQKSVDHPGPMCIRIARGAEPLVYTEEYEYEIGKAIVAHEGNDLVPRFVRLFAVGLDGGNDKLMDIRRLPFGAAPGRQQTDLSVSPRPKAQAVKPAVRLPVFLQPDKCHRLIAKAPRLNEPQGLW